jgi:hypothetical protein
MKCPSCDQTLKRIEGVCGEYICLNLECLENKKAHVGAYKGFYGLTQTEICQNYRASFSKKLVEEIRK